MNDSVEITALTRRYGAKVALDDVSLRVPPGTVFGLVGENGAGKTTLIKHVLGLLQAEQGTVRVFGIDPIQDPPAVLSRVGCLSEDRDLPLWMRVHELCRYTQAFYPTWDAAYAERLREDFQLDPDARLRTLSRGELAKAGLLVALAYRPDLLVLDEPSSGLDPVVRRDILEAIVRTVAEEGRTVLFSSHLLDEIERVSDQLALLVNGRIVLSGTTDDVKRRHSQLTLRFPVPQTVPPCLPGALAVSGSGVEWTVTCNGGRAQLERAARELGAQIVGERGASLDDVFVAHVRRQRTAEPSRL